MALSEHGSFNLTNVLLFQKKFPSKVYSALAGFVEPGESYEDAVKREMWEEAGMRVWNIRYHSGQPWVSGDTSLENHVLSPPFFTKPFPANLMLGFYATADSSAPIRLDLDNELEGRCLFMVTDDRINANSGCMMIRRSMVYPSGGIVCPSTYQPSRRQRSRRTFVQNTALHSYRGCTD